MSVVQITNGFYRNQEVTGIFPVVQELKEAKDGTHFITVDASETEFNRAKMRVKVRPEISKQFHNIVRPTSKLWIVSQNVSLS